MKKLFFVWVFMLVGTFAFANTSIKEDDSKIEISIKSNDAANQVCLNFNSIDSFNNFDLNQLTDISSFNVKDDCSVNVSVTVSVGVISVTVGAENIPCEKVKEKIKELIAEAKDAILT